jgi:hypothetical protein
MAALLTCAADRKQAGSNQNPELHPRYPVLTNLRDVNKTTQFKQDDLAQAQAF